MSEVTVDKNVAAFRSLLQHAIDSTDAEGAKVHSYSGRGMYGKECVAVTFRYASDEAEVLFQLGQMAAEMDGYVGGMDLAHAVRVYINSRRTDSMGLGVVVYFPAASLPASDDEDSD